MLKKTSMVNVENSLKRCNFLTFRILKRVNDQKIEIFRKSSGNTSILLK